MLLHIQKSKLRWFWHLVRMSPGHLHREVFQTRWRPWGRPRIFWTDDISQMAEECHLVSLEELEEVAKRTKIRVSLLREDLPQNLYSDKPNMMVGWPNDCLIY